MSTIGYRGGNGSETENISTSLGWVILSSAGCGCCEGCYGGYEGGWEGASSTLGCSGILSEVSLDIVRTILLSQRVTITISNHSCLVIQLESSRGVSRGKNDKASSYEPKLNSSGLITIDQAVELFLGSPKCTVIVVQRVPVRAKLKRHNGTGIS